MEILESILTYILYISLAIHIILMVLVAFRLWRGENIIDRLMASDVLSNLAIAVFVLGTMIHHQKIFLDVALGLAALGFISVIAYAKYTTDKRMF